ncbi:actin superfamily [Micromonas commoda]|uniref:Actin superfamily n=1 Tax=Micromonas commoda (strain RCC299 / NOUM17 / CCMP2709) TaxID=296587 RepID=C1E8N7_MICCC|nr:actin superfamily [Micromonas commoda]ACO64185.1 actin superfamily [Micromonas commoda]|eukprot:XP_002502927.1 actin superfamily [Micromonas commoda]
MTGTRKDIVVVDLGGSTIKVGFAGDADPSRCASPAASLPPDRCVVPNCVAKPKGEKRSYIADEINQVKDISSLNLRRPVDRGYVVNWDLQRDILDHVFKKVLKINPRNCHLVITEAPFNLPALAAEQDECIFEKFGFKSALICPPSLLALTYHLAKRPRSDPCVSARCGVVVDAGFSFVHATPVFDGRVLRNGIRRVNLGGKALTNYLKEMVSYRQWNMMDEYVLMDDVKEKLCYVAGCAVDELKRAKVRGASNEVNREYVLPDGVHCLGMGNERFMVPEALFHPADIGLNQAGVAEVVTQAVRSVATDLRAMMYANVIVAGGCAAFPGFKERFEAELRPLVPTDEALTVEVSTSPTLDAWRGGSVVGAGEDFERLAVTREAWKKDASEFRRRYEEHAGVVKGRM